MKIIKNLSVAVLALFSLSLSAQEVEYRILDDAPQLPKLSTGITLGDVILHTGEEAIGSGGPGIFATYRPTERIKIGGQVSSGLFGLMTNDTENATGIRKAGGIFIDVNGEFAWRRKGVNIAGRTGRFHIPNFEGVTKYITIPYNRMVERTIRGGFYTHTYPFSTTTGGFIGIGKYSTTFAKLDFDGTIRTDGTRMGWTLDYVFATTNYVDEMRTSDPTGLRLGIHLETFGKIKTLTRFEIGGMPGVDGTFMRLTFNFPLVNLGSHRYTGDYKELKETDSKIINFVRKL